MTLALHPIVVNSLFNSVGLRSLDSDLAGSYGLILNSNSTIQKFHLKIQGCVNSSWVNARRVFTNVRIFIIQANANLISSFKVKFAAAKFAS
jgi:hypothetical protein